MMKKKKKITQQQNAAQKRARQYVESLDDDKVKIVLKIDNYQQVGFTIQSILKVCQSSLFAHEVNAEHHEFLDIVNLLDLACQLVPMDKLEEVDKLRNHNL